ncbi:hypothetical protein DCC62_32110, partial [candidate division KSB1 bacterium]
TVVMTIKPAGDADLHGGSEARRGGNVYRVWITTENFWQKPYLAEDGGKKFFGERLAKAFRREEAISPPPPEPVPEEQEQLIAADTLEPPPVATAEPEEPPVEEVIADSAVVDTPEVVDAANVVEETPAPPEEPQQAEEVRAETSAFEPATSSSHEPNPETETEWTWTEPADSPIAEEELAESQNSFEPAPPEKEEAQPMATVKAPSRLFEGSGTLAAISAIAALILLPVLSVVFSPTFRARYCMFRGSMKRFWPGAPAKPSSTSSLRMLICCWAARMTRPCGFSKSFCSCSRPSKIAKRLRPSLRKSFCTKARWMTKKPSIPSRARDPRSNNGLKTKL